jgi:hypothetical protein
MHFCGNRKLILLVLYRKLHILLQKGDVYLKNISSDRPGCRLTGIAVKKRGFDYWCLTTTLAVCQLYRGVNKFNKLISTV